MTKIFISDSVPTSHLSLLPRDTNAMPDAIKEGLERIIRTMPTSHLPFSPGISEPGATVPTGHLPSTIQSPKAPSPKPTGPDPVEQK